MLNTFQSVKELMLGKNYDNILQQSSQGFLFTYDDWNDVSQNGKNSNILIMHNMPL